jgi:D-glycero-alpha-D-manno-heptose-7-phosphate kinase
MIITRTPFRISFIGGGSDLESYYKHNGGHVLSATINKYIYLSCHKYFYENESLVKYSQTENIKIGKSIQHPIIKVVFELFGVSQIDFNSTADIPSGTGMGSSSSFTVGLINLCSTLKDKQMSKSEIAELAAKVEIDLLKEPIGKQDQYAASFGGINTVKFLPNGDTIVTPLCLTNHAVKELHKRLRLYFTGIQRSASSVLKEQNAAMEKLNKRQVLEQMVNFVPVLKEALEIGNYDDLGKILSEGWKLKKSLSSNISNSFIDELYEFGLSCGATGGKLLGAGAGGFMLFYVPIESTSNFDAIMETKLKRFDFEFDFFGTKIIYNDEKFS